MNRKHSMNGDHKNLGLCNRLFSFSLNLRINMAENKTIDFKPALRSAIAAGVIGGVVGFAIGVLREQRPRFHVLSVGTSWAFLAAVYFGSNEIFRKKSALEEHHANLVAAMSTGAIAGGIVGKNIRSVSVGTLIGGSLMMAGSILKNNLNQINLFSTTEFENPQTLKGIHNENESGSEGENRVQEPSKYPRIEHFLRNLPSWSPIQVYDKNNPPVDWIEVRTILLEREIKDLETRIEKLKNEKL